MEIFLHQIYIPVFQGCGLVLGNLTITPSTQTFDFEGESSNFK